MKTKKLIELLQKEDPTGELDVCVDNIDIHFVERLPAYYDGCQEVLIRDESSPYYNIVGAKYCMTGQKVKIHTLSIVHAIWTHYDMPIDYSNLTKDRAESYKAADDKHRKSARDCEYELELEYFIKHMRERAGAIYSNTEGIDDAAKKFFDENMSPKDPIPKDIPVLGDSYIGRRNKQWQREIDVTFDGWQWTLTKKGA